MKKIFLITLLTVLTATVGHAANDDIVVDGVVYKWSPNELGYIVTGWDEETPIQSLHIRGEVEGLDVVGIADEAFNPSKYKEDEDDEEEQSLLPLFESVEIDEGITYIGENAFIDCTGIKWVRMPSTLRTIGSYSFCRCFSLEYAFLNEGLMTIEEEAFAFCEKLNTMVIPSTVTEIQAHAFSGCTGVTDVYFLLTDVDILMDDGPDGFAWWDGVYPLPGEEEHGGMEFNTNESTVVHVPEGMLQDYVDSEKFNAWLPLHEDDNTYPLWWIVNFGVVGRDYTVSDKLMAVYVDVDGELYAKDDNNWLTPDEVYPGEIDYMRTTVLMNNKPYDQSNWVVLTNLDTPDGFKGLIFDEKTITGKLIDKKNPTIKVSEDSELVTTDTDQPIQYEPNIYIPCSFMGRAQIGANDKTYAFVQPKPQELIHVEWSIYNDEDECFYIPEPDGVANTMGLRGGFGVSYDLYEKPNDMPELKDRYIYAFDAINRLKTVSEPDENETKLKFGRLRDEDDPQYEPYTDGGVSDKFIVYPLELPKNPPMTGVPEIIDDFTQAKAGWFSIDGRYLGTTKPTVPGLYIYGNRKVIVK